MPIRQKHQHGSAIPRRFELKEMPSYIRFANDNIDITEETLSGKGTFHASQTVAFVPPVVDLSDPDEEFKIESGFKTNHASSRRLSDS